MQTLTEKLKAAIIAESYEDRAGRSVISVKSALDIIDRLAAEQPDPVKGIIEQMEDLQDVFGYDSELIQICINIVREGLSNGQSIPV